MAELSPKAQAVLDAYYTHADLAAALCAAADQVVPKELASLSKWPERYEIRRQLLAIAAELAQPDPDGSSKAFAIVQKRLDQLAGDQELMIYSWPNREWREREWSIEHTNPSPYVQLGEVSGKYSSDGLTLEQAVCNLAALLPENHASQTEAP